MALTRNSPSDMLARPVGAASPWPRAGLLLALLIGLTLVLYRETALAMVEIWMRSGTFAHAFVVPPISLWLIWRRREVLARAVPHTSLSALALLAGAAMVWLAGWLGQVNALAQFALVGLLISTVLVVLGFGVARLILFPLLFLFFAVPFGEFMLPQLMQWTADFTVAAVRLSGVPVYREGLHFIIPSGSWSVVEACSGIRYLIASLMVGTLFAYLNYNSTKRRVLFVLVAALLPLGANWLRAYLIVMLGHLSDNVLAAGVDHLLYGWVLFGIVMLALFMVGARWAEPELSAAEILPTVEPASAASRGGALWLPALLAAVLLIAPHLFLHVERAGSVVAPPPLQAPAAAPGWAAAAQPAEWRPNYQRPATELQAAYQRAGGASVGLYIGYYANQDRDSKLIGSHNTLVASDDKQWIQVSSGRVPLTLAGQSLDVRSGTVGPGLSGLAGSTTSLRVLQFFWVNGQLTTSDAMAKIHGVIGRLLKRGDDAAVVIVYADARADAGELEKFLADHWAGIEQRLRAAQGPRP